MKRTIVLIVFLLFVPIMVSAQQGTVIVKDGASATQASVKTAGTVTPNVIGVQGNASGVPIPVNVTSSGGSTIIPDPCQTVTPVAAPISIVTATTVRIVAPTSAKKTYICSIFLYASAADNVAIVEGTGGTCGAGAAGVIGGATAATGLLFAANQGFVLPATGYWQAVTAGTNVDLCIITSTTAQLSGVVKTVQAP